MGSVQMVPDDLRSFAGVLVREADRQISLYNEARETILGLGSDWKGDAYDRGLLEVFENQEHVIKRRTDLLREFAQLIRETGDDLQNMDNDLVRSFSV